MKWAREIGPALNLRADEGARAALLLLHSFFLGASLVFFETAASALFLANFDATALPYVYLAAAAVVPLTGIAFAKLEERVSNTSVFLATVAFLLAVMIAFRVVLATSSARPSASSSRPPRTRSRPSTSAAPPS